MNRPISRSPGPDEVSQLGVRRRGHAGRYPAAMDRGGRKRRGRHVAVAGCEPIGGAAGEAAPLTRSAGKELGRTGYLGYASTVRCAPRAWAGGAGTAGRPGRRCGPVTRRIAPDRGLLDRRRRVAAAGRSRNGVTVGLVCGRRVALVRLVVAVLPVVARWCRVRAGARGGRDRGSLPFATRMGGLAPRPVLEGRADRERTRQAVRLLVRSGARRRERLGEAAVSMVRARRPRFAIVLERHERTGRRAVDARKPSLGHRENDTRRNSAEAVRHAGGSPWPAAAFRLNGPVVRGRDPSGSRTGRAPQAACPATSSACGAPGNGETAPGAALTDAGGDASWPPSRRPPCLRSSRRPIAL